MNSKYWILPLLLLASCGGEPKRGNQTIAIDTLRIDDFEVIVSSDSGHLADPRELVLMNGNGFAVYDKGFNQIILFDQNGNKTSSFGKTGRGPGEWGQNFGATDLNFVEDQFLIYNRETYSFQLYDANGQHIHTVRSDQKFNYNFKLLLPDQTILVATDGQDSSLAVVMDLKDGGRILRKYGTPKSEYIEMRSFEEERISYSNGSIPASALNDVLVAKTDVGAVLFFKATGELRHVSDDGEILFTQELPASLKDPVLQNVIIQNRDFAMPNTVLPLEYFHLMRVRNNLIYLFNVKHAESGEGLDSRIMVYDMNGELKKHYVYSDPINESFIGMMAVGDEDDFFFIDSNARILKYSP
jgi:hypothetical protein